LPPDAPKHLSAPSQALWDSIHTTFDLEDHERETLRLALEALDRANIARRALRRHGLVYTDRHGQPRTRPEVSIEREARNAWARLMGGLKLPADTEPAARQPRSRRGTFSRAAQHG